MTRSELRLNPRRVPQQARSTETRAILLEAAGRVLGRVGENVTTRMIAEVAGVSIGSLYQYFPTKEAILCAWEDDRVTRAFVDIERSCASEGALDEDALTDVLARVLRVVRETKIARLAMHDESRDHADLSSRIASFLESRLGATPPQTTRVRIAVAAMIGASSEDPATDDEHHALDDLARVLARLVGRGEVRYAESRSA